MSLPRVFFTIDGNAVRFDQNWACNTSANLGCDQFTGTLSAARARQLQIIQQGATLGAYTERSDTPFWQGRISGPPKMQQDGTAVIHAQGHGYAAVKYGGRLPIRISDGGAWRDASEAPLNWPTESTATQVNVAGPGTAFASGGPNGTMYVNVSAGVTTHVAVAIWVPGARFTGITGSIPSWSHIHRIWTATGPDIAATRTLEQIYAAGSIAELNVKFVYPQDCVVIEAFNTSAMAAVQNMVHAQLDLKDTTHPGVPQFSSVYAELDPAYIPTARQFGVSGGDSFKFVGWKLYSHHAVRGVGNKLGFDVSGIGEVGLSALTNFDWAGGAASAIDDLASGDDLCWGVYHDAGNGPVMTLEPYDARTYEVSGRTGARWDLDPLELYNRVVTQFVEATSGKLGNVTADAYPDPLEASGLTNELQLSIQNKQYSRDRANLMTWRGLNAGLATRYRGRISAGRVFEAATGRECTYDTRPGTVRIKDYGADGTDLSLRIADLQFGPQGVVIGVEAPALPIGSITGADAGRYGGTGGGGGAPAQLPDYLPPGAPGNPIGGGNVKAPPSGVGPGTPKTPP